MGYGHATERLTTASSVKRPPCTWRKKTSHILHLLLSRGDGLASGITGLVRSIAHAARKQTARCTVLRTEGRSTGSSAATGAKA